MKNILRKRILSFTICSAIFAFICLSGCRVEVKESEGKPFTSENLQKIVLTISGVGLGFSPENQSDEEMLTSFEKNSGAKIVISQTAHTNNVQTYLSYLDLLDHSASLPDIIIFPSLSAISEKLILYDITDMVTAEQDWKEVPIPLQKAVTTAENIFAVPLRYSLEGYFINQDLFQKEKLSVPSFGFTFNYFTQSIQNLTANKQIIPLSNFYDIPLWYPLTKEDSAVWGAYGKNGFDLENKIFSTGIHYAWQLKKECYSSADAANLPAYSPNTAQSQWKSGKTVFWYESTQNLSDIKTDTFTGSFIGIPGKTSVIDASYIGITANAAHKKEAFALIKWLSFSSDGVKKRLSSTSNPMTNQIPLTQNSNLLLQFLKQCNYKGIAEALEQINQAVVKGDDYLPQYTNVMFQTQYHLSDSQESYSLEKILQMAIDGKLSYAEISKELNRLVHRKEDSST